MFRETMETAVSSGFSFASFTDDVTFSRMSVTAATCSSTKVFSANRSRISASSAVSSCTSVSRFWHSCMASTTNFPCIFSFWYSVSASCGVTRIRSYVPSIKCFRYCSDKAFACSSSVRFLFSSVSSSFSTVKR